MKKQFPGKKSNCISLGGHHSNTRMSFEDHPFRWVPSLQHMTKVKIIETLWRSYKGGHGIMKLIKEEFPSLHCLMEPMSGSLKTMIHDLPIPTKLQLELEWPLERMIDEALSWLDTTRQHNPRLGSLDEDWAAAISYFIDNLCFTNSGCVDGRKILESYVSGKEIVGYWVWHELCSYCIEDKIVEFSKKIDWQECSNCLNWRCSVYWYRKIHGKLPSDEMLTDSEYLQRDKKNLIGAFSNEENLIRNMLKAYITRCGAFGSVAPIVYFRNQLTNDGEFNSFVSDILPQIEITPVFIYLLRTRAKDALLDSISHRADDILRELMKWPWIFFIDNWKRMFYTNVDAAFFIAFFYRIGEAISKMTGHFKVVLYRVLEEIVGIFHERFISNSEVIAQAFWKVFFKEDAGYMCSVILKGLESHQRKFVIEEMRRYVHIEFGNDIDIDRSDIYLHHSVTDEKLHRSEYCVDEVFSVEERKIFWETYDQYLAETMDDEDIEYWSD